MFGKYFLIRNAFWLLAFSSISNLSVRSHVKRPVTHTKQSKGKQQQNSMNQPHLPKKSKKRLITSIKDFGKKWTKSIIAGITILIILISYWRILKKKHHSSDNNNNNNNNSSRTSSNVNKEESSEKINHSTPNDDKNKDPGHIYTKTFKREKNIIDQALEEANSLYPYDVWDDNDSHPKFDAFKAEFSKLKKDLMTQYKDSPDNWTYHDKNIFERAIEYRAENIFNFCWKDQDLKKEAKKHSQNTIRKIRQDLKNKDLRKNIIKMLNSMIQKLES